MTKDEVAERFYATRDREAMATLVMRIRRLDVDRALFLLEGFAEKLMEISRNAGYDVAVREFDNDG